MLGVGDDLQLVVSPFVLIFLENIENVLLILNSFMALMTSNAKFAPELSLTGGDYCKDGTWTVFLAVGFFFFLFGAHQALYYYHRSLTSHSKHNNDEAKTDHKNSFNYWMERIFIFPFRPVSLEVMVGTIFFAWFLLTIPMATTRFYEGRWGNQLVAQQGPLNIIAMAMGCEGLDINAISYAMQGNFTTAKVPEDNVFKSLLNGLKKKRKSPDVTDENLAYSPDIDFYFSHHLFFGLLWLTVGSAQMYLARKGWSVCCGRSLCS